MSATAVTVADLRPIDLFEELSDVELEEFAVVAEMHERATGELVIEAGQEPAGLTCLLEGTLSTAIMVDGRPEQTGHQEAPTWIGAIAVVTEGPLGVRMTARTPVRWANIPAEDFRRLALAHPSVHRRVMQQVQPVMSRITGWEHNRERLASLGTMAAGLAHELNNPASAAERAASSLCEALDVLASSMGRFVESGIEREEAGHLVELQREALARREERTVLDALDAADAEEALEEVLQDAGVSDPWRLTEPLAQAGLDADWVERVREQAGDATPLALQWVAASLTARGLAGELRESSKRMSSLVGAVKTYAYMDRGGEVTVDVHEGIETTLVVLGHKLKHTEIKVAREYDRTLPPITVHGSEVNQVWTNLLDNAIDALGERGTITISTSLDDPCIRVDIADDGPGIPAENIGRIFDPFFTTKEVGHGTGLGLDTARRIVVDRHDGAITVESRPGATVFHVWLRLGE